MCNCATSTRAQLRRHRCRYTRPLRLARGKEPGDRRPVGWTRSDVKKPDGARRIDKDIAAELTHIAVEIGGSGQSSSEQLLRVRPPRAWTPDVPPLAAEHAVPLVKRPRLVDENGPPNTRSGCVRAGLRPALERHYDDADGEFLKHRFVLLQLQQMPTARQSAQMPMEDQQEPVPAVIVEVVEPTFRIRQRKRHRRITDMYAHEDSPLYPRSPPVQRPISRAASGAKRSPSVRGSKLPGLRVPGAWPVSMRAAASAASVRILEDPVVARLRLRSWRSPPYRQRRADVLMPAPGNQLPPPEGRYEEGPSKGPSISQVPVSPVSSRLLPASGCNRG